MKVTVNNKEIDLDDLQIIEGLAYLLSAGCSQFFAQTEAKHCLPEIAQLVDNQRIAQVSSAIASAILTLIYAEDKEMLMRLALAHKYDIAIYFALKENGTFAQGQAQNPYENLFTPSILNNDGTTPEGQA